MEHCMFCTRNSTIFKILDKYGNSSRTVKDDIIQFFGKEAEEFLREDDCVCNICVTILESVADLKAELWPLIRRHNLKAKSPVLLKVWDIFSEYQNDSLLVPSHSDPYDAILENRIETMAGKRSLSSASYSSKYAHLDVELQSIFNESKKKSGKRGKERKSLYYTHRKRSKSTISNASARKTPCSVVSGRPRGRPKGSRAKTMSPVSCYSVGTILKYDKDNRLMNKRTRSVSRAQEEEAQAMDAFKDNLYYCTEKGCELPFEDIDILAHHQVNDHNLVAMYICKECNQAFVESNHLKKHQTFHDDYTHNCFMCGQEIVSTSKLQQHLRDHSYYSAPCQYCDKSFLDKTTVNNHIKACHKGKKKRTRHNQKVILDRIDKYDTTDSESEEEKEKVKEHAFDCEIEIMNLDRSTDQCDEDIYMHPMDFRRMFSGTSETESTCDSNL